MEKRFWQEITVLYALGILLVIIGHSHSSDWSTFEHTPLEELIQFIYTFHMALFFAIAGFLFQNSETLIQIGYGKWLKEKALRLMTPYLFWSLLAFLPKFYLEHHSFKGLTFGNFLESIFFPRLNIWGHFWFLPTLFLCYLVFGAIRAYLPGTAVRLLLATELAATTALYFSPLKSQVLGLSDLREFALFFTVGIVFNQLFTIVH